ncbi:hypothetical protein AB3S75_031537 [Citrus x aurantiifolia]
MKSRRIGLQNRASHLEVMVVRFTHAFHEGNCVADKVANLGAQAAGFFWCSDSPSDLFAHAPS